MTKSQRQKQNFIQECESLFGESDHWGHFKWECPSPQREYRIKIGKTSCRYETKIGGQWKKISGWYYTNEKSIEQVQTIHRSFN